MDGDKTMKKSELIQALALYPEEAEIVLWVWDGRKSSYEFLNATCTSYPDFETGKLRHPERFEFSHSYCPYTPTEEVKEKGPVEDDRQLGDLKPKRIRKARS